MKIDVDHRAVRFSKSSRSYIRWERDYRRQLDENEQRKQMAIRKKAQMFDALLRAHRKQLQYDDDNQNISIVDRHQSYRDEPISTMSSTPIIADTNATFYLDTSQTW